MPILPLLRLIPPWVAIVAAALAWGAFQRHRANDAAAELADMRAAANAATQAAARAAAANQEIAHAAQNDAARARGDADAAAAALRRLRQRAAGRADQAASAPAGSPAACDATAVPADVLQRLGEAAGQLADIADRRGIAGSACERAYESLRGQ